ncbi:hypothetical protein [Carnimonas bestiolae]|uniref:hypothetical protein n=1 Tax=Carnimonas bestiolae TaxID=3402172 RepID=UPI003EDBE960
MIRETRESENMLPRAMLYERMVQYVDSTDDTPLSQQDRISEQEIGWAMNQWLNREGWETYPEVVLSQFPGRPDLVGVRRGVCMVVECKRTLTFQVIEQAARWHFHSRPEQSGMPHLVWIACGRSRQRRSDLIYWLLHHFGIGLIEVDREPDRRWARIKTLHEGDDERGLFRYSIQHCAPAFVQPGSRQMARRLISQLNHDMRIARPGARSGDTHYMTPFKRSIALIIDLLDSHPDNEYHIEHIVDYLNKNGGHHYVSEASAKTSLTNHLDRLGFPRARKYGPWFKAKPLTPDQPFPQNQ